MTRINTNVASMIAQSNLSRTNQELQVRLERLSTGLRINRGADDPAGLIVSERLRSEIRGLEQAVKNSERAGSVIATAEGYLAEVADMLNSIKALAVEAANTGAVSKEEIEANQGVYTWETYDQIVNEMSRREISVIAVIVDAPDWSRDSATLDSADGPPADPSMMGTFVQEHEARAGRPRFGGAIARVAPDPQGPFLAPRLDLDLVRIREPAQAPRAQHRRPQPQLLLGPPRRRRL
jgi:hypothetical protein